MHRARLSCSGSERGGDFKGKKEQNRRKKKETQHIREFLRPKRQVRGEWWLHNHKTVKRTISASRADCFLRGRRKSIKDVGPGPLYPVTERGGKTREKQRAAGVVKIGPQICHPRKKKLVGEWGNTIGEETKRKYATENRG